MSIVEQIQQMPLREKLFALEAIWDDISRSEVALEMPQWHQTLLDQREQLIAEGKAHFLGWETAKEQIQQILS